MTLEGDLTPSGMKRIFSLFDRPPSFEKPADASPAPQAPPATETPATPLAHPPAVSVPPATKTSEIDSNGHAAVRAELDAAQAYFKRVAGYVDDLRTSSRDAATLGASALWCESYARKIDELPVVGVDPDLAAYGQRTADAMRQASELIRGDNAESKRRRTESM